MNIQMVLLRGFRLVLFYPSVVLKCGLMVLLGWNIHEGLYWEQKIVGCTSSLREYYGYFYTTCPD